MLPCLISISDAIGRFHPVLVHLPIGILLMAVALQWLSPHPKYGVSAQVVKLVFLVGIAGALLSSITGFLLSNSGNYDDSAVALHMWLAILTTAFSLLAFARFVQQQPDAKWLSLVLVLLLVLTGHFGASLSHGADYLTGAREKEERQGAMHLKPKTDAPQ